jgi:general secretion pathway protein H
VKNRGFSLIELVIVLIVLSLSISLVTPAFSRFAKTIELKGAVKKVSGILRYCRSEAVQKGKVHQVLFDADLREVRVQSVEPAEDKEGGEKREEKAPQKRYPLPEGIQMRELKIPSPQYPSDLPAIEFYPNGGSNGGSILLERQDHKGYRIKIHFLTGMVQVEGV